MQRLPFRGAEMDAKCAGRCRVRRHALMSLQKEEKLMWNFLASLRADTDTGGRYQMVSRSRELCPPFSM